MLDGADRFENRRALYAPTSAFGTVCRKAEIFDFRLPLLILADRRRTETIARGFLPELAMVSR